jgi:hypothetical protein
MVRLYIEGGGDSKSLQIECRKGFRNFIEKAGLKGKMPSIIACGGRKNAYDSYCTAIENGENAVLLVDSECPLSNQDQQGSPETWQPWQHLKQRQGDGWEKPNDGVDTDCHLMVQCMENWLLADRDTLKTFFGQGFAENQLPAAAKPIESIDKNTAYEALAKATASCKTKASYGKGEHSFKLLANIDSGKVTDSSPWAKRFVEELKKKMGV